MIKTGQGGFWEGLLPSCWPKQDQLCHSHLSNLFFPGWALEFFIALQYIPTHLLAFRGKLFLVLNFYLQFKPVTKSMQKKRHISSFAAVFLLTYLLSGLNSLNLPAFPFLATFHPAAIIHFLLLWALHVLVRVCVLPNASVPGQAARLCCQLPLHILVPCCVPLKGQLALVVCTKAGDFSPFHSKSMWNWKIYWHFWYCRHKHMQILAGI